MDPRHETVELSITVNQSDIEEHIVQKQREKEASKKSSGMAMGGGSSEPVEEKKQEKEEKKEEKKVEKKDQRDSFVVKPRPNAKVKKSALEDELR